VRSRTVPLVEATIDDIQNALLRRDVTVRSLVEGYLTRIESYDRSGPAFNAILARNPDVLAQADRLDQDLARRDCPARCTECPCW
jgi:amidase